MKRFFLIFVLLLSVAISASAQRAKFEVTFSPSVSADLSKVYVRPLNNGEEGQAVTLRLKDENYVASVPVSNTQRSVAHYGILSKDKEKGTCH